MSVQKNWRFYENDAAEPTSALAAENAKPTLTDTGKIRLRAGIYSQGYGSYIYHNLQYSTNEVNWTDFGSGNHWDWADGAATGSTQVTGYLLSDTIDKGYYLEAGGLGWIYFISAFFENDYCIQQTGNASSGTTYYFRILDISTEVPLGDGETHAQVTTYSTASASPSASPSGSVSSSPSSSVSSSPSQSASPSATPSSSVSASPSSSYSSSVSASPSSSPSSSVSATPSSSPSISSSVSASVSSTPSASISPSASVSASPSASQSPSASVSATPSSSVSASVSSSPSSSISPSSSVSSSVSSSPSISSSVSASPSSSVSATPSSSPSASTSSSPSASVSATPSSSQSPSSSVSSSPSSSVSASPSSSRSPSASPSASPSSSPSPSASYMYDPIVTAGCPQCGTLLYSEGEAIRSDTVNHGRNADNEDNYVRCARCGFPCNLNRDKQSRRGSKDGWGIEYSEIARPSDAVTH